MRNSDELIFVFVVNRKLEQKIYNSVVYLDCQINNEKYFEARYKKADLVENPRYSEQNVPKLFKASLLLKRLVSSDNFVIFVASLRLIWEILNLWNEAKLRQRGV